MQLIESMTGARCNVPSLRNVTITNWKDNLVIRPAPARMATGREAGRKVLSTYVFNQSVHYFITGITFPILVLLIMDKGLGIAEAGVALAAYSAATILLELPSGSLADTIGRKNIYLLSLGIQAAGGLALLLSFDLVTVMAAAATMGAARAFSSGSIDAWFIDEYRRAEPDGNIQHALARAGTFTPLGLGIGSLAGGAIPSLSGIWSPVIPLSTYSMNIVVMELMVAVQFILTVAMVQENVTQHADKLGSVAGRLQNVIATSFRHGVKDRTVLLLLFATLLFGISLSSLELLWQPRVQSILGTSELSWVLGVLAAGYFFSASAGSMLSTRVCGLFHDRYPFVVFAFRLLAGVLLLLLAFQDTILGFALFYFLILMTEGVADPPDATMYNAELPGPVRSTMLSFKSLVLQIGGLVGTLVIGFLAGAYSIGLAWTVAAVILGASSLSYLFLALRSAPVPVSEETIGTA